MHAINYRVRPQHRTSSESYGLRTEIIHSVRRYDLTEREWTMIGVIGQEVARKMNLKLDWGGNATPYEPYAWYFANWTEYREEIEAACEQRETLPEDEREYFHEIEARIKARRKQNFCPETVDLKYRRS